MDGFSQRGLALSSENRKQPLATIYRRAAIWGIVPVALPVPLAVLDSGNLRCFDAAVVGYLFGTFFEIFGVTAALVALSHHSFPAAP